MNWAAVIWLILIVVFLLVEASTVTLVSTWFAIGSLAALLVALTGAGVGFQIAIAVIVSAKEIVIGGTRKIGGRLSRILVIGNVSGLLHRNSVEHTVARNRIGNPRLEIMEIDVGHVLREENLI